MNTKIFINEKRVNENIIFGWEDKRCVAVAKLLNRKVKNQVVVTNSEELLQLKEQIGEERIRKILKPRIALCTLLTRVMLIFSFGKRKSSIITMNLKGSGAERLQELYFDEMLNNTKENLRLSLRANPDHYVVKGVEGMVQEVIETTGALPLPSQFFIHYGKEDGLLSKKDPEYQVQAAGICCLKDGTIIGGVRHQMRDTEEGCKVKLEVEFPKSLPNAIIR